MPKISEFYGIKIFIFWDETGAHNLPHFHAYYGEFEATFKLDGTLIIGKMPRTAKKLIRIWALENYDLIVYTWELAMNKKPLPWVQGLK
jgi:hypothetical protein